MRRNRYLSRKAWLAKRRAEGDDGKAMYGGRLCSIGAVEYNAKLSIAWPYPHQPTWRNDPMYFAAERVRAARAAKRKESRNGND